MHESHTRIPPDRWCISRKDLEYFEETVKQLHSEEAFKDDRNQTGLKIEDIGPTVFIVNEKYIKPETLSAGGMSWALMRNRNGLDCHLFATHCWQEGIFEFIIKVKRAWPRQAHGLWCCFLAIPQNGNISDILGSDPNTSPFAIALTGAKYMVVVPNHKTSIYKRLWCVFEAWVAMNELNKRPDLKITIPLHVRTKAIFVRVLPGLIFPSVGVFLGVWVLGPIAGFALGPVMWLLTMYLICQAISRLANYRILRRKATHKDACLSMIRVCYMELFIIGIGSGLAWWHLFGVECHDHTKLFEGLCMPSKSETTVRSVIFGVEHLGFRFEDGEEVSVMLLLASLVCVYVWHIERLLVRKCIELECSMLDFETVGKADCTSNDDRLQIMDHIQDDVNKIDRMIKMLKSIGRYNDEVKYNVEMGLPWELCRDGLNYFKLAAAVVTLEFWWITDLAGHKHYGLAFGLPFVTTLVLSVIAYTIGEKLILLISTSLMFGVLFVIISNHHFFFTHLAVVSRFMTGSTAWLQVFMLLLLTLIDVCMYWGLRNVLPHRCGDILANMLVCGNCEDVTSDEDAPRLIRVPSFLGGRHANPSESDEDS